MQRVADETAFDPEWSADVLGPPEVWGVERLGADGVTIRLVVKTRPLAPWNVARQLRSRLKATFAEEGIGIPFPQRVVWHRGVEDAGPAPSADGHRPGVCADAVGRSRAQRAMTASATGAEGRDGATSTPRFWNASCSI